MALENDTIAAIATPPGRGGVGIVRVSGKSLQGLAQAVAGRQLSARKATYCRFRNAAGALIDDGLALYFPAPNSFTGEDVLELQGHGGPVVMDALLQATLDGGARLARPGEFSERAFLNGKLDLVQAEAVADLINAGSTQAARAAMRSLHGEFSREVRKLVEQLIDLRAYVEAAIDFAEEEIDFLREGDVEGRLQGLREQVAQVLRAAGQGVALREGLRVAIIGRPNAGKSTLWNALAGAERAIVTPIPGTTRDVLRETITIDGMPVQIIDTAGLRDSLDLIEQEGVRRARTEMAEADHVLWVIDGTDSSGRDPDHPALPVGEPPGDRHRLTLIVNKIDVAGSDAGPLPRDLPVIRLSAKTGEGLPALRRHLLSVAGFAGEDSGLFTARRRHLEALQTALAALECARAALGQAPELVAEDLLQAQRALGEITGEFTSDDLLGKIFSSFCIGK